MNTLDAINKRKSRRSYISTPIDKNIIVHFEALMKAYNEKENLHIQFIKDGSKPFKGIKNSYGMFSGVQSFFALVGPKNDENSREKLGFYGELLVLEATKYNLGTCWVAGTYNKKDCPCSLKDNEELFCVIIVGHVEEKLSFKENTIYKLAHRSTKPLEALYSSQEEIPDWFLVGMKSVQKAPSAINKQPVNFDFMKGVVTASIADKADYERIDLGIAKVHFHLAVERGSWEWGNGGKYIFTNN